MQREIFITLESIHSKMNGTIQQNKTLYLMVCIHYQWKEERAISLMHVCSSGCWYHRTKILHFSVRLSAAIESKRRERKREGEHVCMCVCAHFSFERALPGIYIFQWKFTLRFSSVCEFFVANSDLSPSLFNAQMLLKSKHVRWIVVTGVHCICTCKKRKIVQPYVHTGIPVYG